MAEVEKRPIGSPVSFFKGFLGGSLISSGIFSGLGAGIQAAIFIIGLLIVIDTIISRTEEIYPMSMFLGSVAGFFIALFSAIAGIAPYYTLIIIVLSGLVYLSKLLKRLKK